MLGDPVTDLTIAMELNYFQLNRAECFVPMVVKIPGRELELAKKFGTDHTLIDFVCEVMDEATGGTITAGFSSRLSLPSRFTSLTGNRRGIS